MKRRHFMHAHHVPALNAARRAWPSVLHVLLSLNVAVALLQLGLGWQVAVDSQGAVLPLGGVSVQSLARGEVWGLVTSLFVHTGAAHLLVNLFVIAFFGKPLLGLLGGRVFTLLYFCSGLVGIALQLIVQALLVGDTATPLMGASACACGLMVAAAAVLPEDPLTEWVYSILPIKLSLQRMVKLLVLGTLVLGVSALVFQWAAEHWGGSAYFAHLGGMATGWYAVRLLGMGERPLTYETLIREKRWSPQPARERKVARKSFSSRLAAVTPDMDDSAVLRERRSTVRPTKPVVQDVDSILEKISREGMSSLSAEERSHLESASRELRAQKM